MAELSPGEPYPGLKLLPSLLRFLALGFALLASTATSTAEDVRVSWNPVEDPNIVGYRVYCYATSQSVPDGTVDSAGANSVLVKGLHSGRLYEFRVHSVNAMGLESPPSTSTYYQTAGRDTNPVADSQNLRIYEGTTQTITLTATDEDGDALIYSLVSGPSYGNLEGTPPTLVYEAPIGYVGPDRFRFSVRDQTRSSEADIRIEILPAPGRTTIELNSVQEDVRQEFIVSAFDAWGEALKYVVSRPPRHGVIDGTAPFFGYKPNPEFSGLDTFTLSTTNSRQEAINLLGKVTVLPVDDPPVADSAWIQIPPGRPTTININAFDPDSSEFTYKITEPPSHGKLSGTPPVLQYLPKSGFIGLDAFALTVNDGKSESEPAIIVLEVGNQASMARQADAGPDQRITLPGQAILRGVVINDGPDDPLNPLVTQWFLVDGPGKVTFDDPFEPITPVHFETPGKYLLELQVYDGDFTSTDSLQVEVRTLSPVAEGTFPWTQYIEAEAGTLTPPMVATAGAPDDPESLLLVTSPTANEGSVALNFTVPQDGEYLVWCRVFTPGPENDTFRTSLDSSAGGEDIADFNQGLFQFGWRWMLLPGRGGTNRAESYSGALTPQVFTLATGPHTLTFHTRNPDTGLDAVIVTQDPNFDPRVAEASTEIPQLGLAMLEESQLQLRWSSIPTRYYQIVSRTGLADSVWTPYGAPIRATGPQSVFVVPKTATSAQSFYAVVLLP